MTTPDTLPPEPGTEAGRRLARDAGTGKFAHEPWVGYVTLDIILAIEAEARAALLAEVREGVEGLVTEAGGRCRLPDDYDPGEMNVCEQHSELLFDEACEDQPRQLLAVLALLDTLSDGGPTDG